MAAKTKIVFGLPEGGVEFRRVFVGQKPEKRGSVRLMAAGAFLFLDGAVVLGILRKKFSHVGQFVLVDFDGPFVALEAHINSIRDKQPLVAPRVRVMAVRAAGRIDNWGMLDRREIMILDNI